MMLTQISAPVMQGTQLPNIARCIKKYLPARQMTYGTNANDLTVLGDSFGSMMRFHNYSHLRGTCLMTGQQATVDMTSNYRTSAILFSSVNVNFMLAVVLWISASFALFYLGGSPKLKDERQMEDALWTSDDIFMGVAIVWNVILVIIILAPDVQRHANIPLNNVVISLVALIATIFVQWQWANFHAHDTHGHDAAAAAAVTVVEDASGGGTTPEVPQKYTPPARVEPDGEALNKPLIPGGAQGESSDAMFSTSNFLSTATAFQKYGAQYAKYMPISMNNLRQRKAAASASFGTASRLERMPNYVAMINTGRPIAMYNYINNIKVRHPCARHYHAFWPNSFHVYTTRCSLSYVFQLCRRRCTTTLCRAWSTPSRRRFSQPSYSHPFPPQCPLAWCSGFSAAF
jgi:hypothetical protein